MLVAALLALAGCDPKAGNHATAAAANPDAQPAAVAIATTRGDYAGTLKPGQLVVVDNPYGDVHARFGGYEHAVETHAVLQEPPRVPCAERENSVGAVLVMADADPIFCKLLFYSLALRNTLGSFAFSPAARSSMATVSIRRRMMASGLIPSASALKFVRMRCRNTG